MAYLKSASPAWQARPGFSGLGSMRRRSGLHGVATQAQQQQLFRTIYANSPSMLATMPAQPSIWPSRGFNHLPVLTAPIVNPVTPGNGVTANTPTDGTTPAPRGGRWWQQLTNPGGSGSSTTNTGAGSTAAQVSGSPVPVGYPTTQIYVAPGGAFWEFNGTSWQSVGTPYNVGGGSTPASTTSSTTSPVPAGYPTNSLYTYTDGSVWQYNAAIGGWTEIQGPSSTTTSLLTDSGAPVGTPTTTVMPADTGYQSLLDWLSGSTLISGVPNWIMAAGIGLAAIKLMHSGKGR
jgi:hypothetical protein